MQEDDGEAEAEDDGEEPDDRCGPVAPRRWQQQQLRESDSDGDRYGWELPTLLSRLTLFSYSAGSSFFAFRVLKST